MQKEVSPTHQEHTCVSMVHKKPCSSVHLSVHPYYDKDYNSFIKMITI